MDDEGQGERHGRHYEFGNVEEVPAKSDGVDMLNDGERPQLLVVQLSARSSSVDMVT